MPDEDPHEEHVMFTFDDAMRPILEILDSRGQMKAKAIADAVADQFHLSEEDRQHLLPSGTQQTYRNRVGWATSNLYKAKCIDRVAHGVYVIAGSGRDLLATRTGKIDNEVLRNHSEEFSTYYDKVQAGRQQPTTANHNERITQTEEHRAPEEVLADSHRELNQGLAAEIKLAILDRSPSFFEELVVRLLVKMGYGGSFSDAAQSVGKAGDGGIDGIIKEDRLGLDAIYIQAKRYQGSVGRPAVQAFVGAITGHRANKGVFLTTGTFTREAGKYVRNLDKTVVLVDGDRLAELMIEFNLGVTLEQTYEIKRIDSDFFEE